MNKNTPTRRVRLAFPKYRHQSAGFIISGFAVATVVASALFWVMHQLISIAQVVVEPEKPPRGIPFIMLERTITPPEKPPHKTDPPPVVDEPMPPSLTDWASSEGIPTFNFIQPANNDLFGNQGGEKTGIGEREYMPLTEIQPNYPKTALVRGIEGTCVVIYTITKTGSVEDVRVDESRCTSNLFHSSAMKAANKFKYAPRIVDGETIEAQNVTKLFRFSITQ